MFIFVRIHEQQQITIIRANSFNSPVLQLNNNLLFYGLVVEGKFYDVVEYFKIAFQL